MTPNCFLPRLRCDLHQAIRSRTWFQYCKHWVWLAALPLPQRDFRMVSELFLAFHRFPRSHVLCPFCQTMDMKLFGRIQCLEPEIASSVQGILLSNAATLVAVAKGNRRAREGRYQRGRVWLLKVLASGFELLTSFATTMAADYLQTQQSLWN